MFLPVTPLWGLAGGPWRTKRQALKAHRRVIDAVDRWWVTIVVGGRGGGDGAGSGGGGDASRPGPGGGGGGSGGGHGAATPLSRGGGTLVGERLYMRMSGAVYVALLGEDADAECLLENWQAAGAYTRSLFSSS